jgi:hypothetical protein
MHILLNIHINNWIGHLENHMSQQNSLSRKLKKKLANTLFILGLRLIYFTPRTTGKNLMNVIIWYSYSSRVQ